MLGEEVAASVASALVGQTFRVSSVTERPFRRSPAAPFMTSTLQQEAGRKLRFSAQRAMQVAQRLYEQGYITYMRTDSTTLSDEALTAARSQARQMYGDEYVPDAPRRYERKVKNAQEAHEAIRPAGETFRTPAQVGRELSGDELRLYELIWMRTVASQMNDATGTSAQLRLTAAVPAGVAQGEEAEFSASGRVITFPGFLRAHEEGRDDDDPEPDAEDRVLPALAEGDQVVGSTFVPGSHTTQPPARYTEASLVKAMEELGVGRPSTYASVIATILDRGYVWKKGAALVPSFTAFAVVGLLERYFGNLVDYGFTASMEDDLDDIAAGTEEALPWLTRFYFGSSAPGAMASDGTEVDTLGLKATVSSHLAEIDAREVNSIPLGDGSDGEPIVARVGRYGPYLQRGEDRASIPDDTAPDELTIERAEEILAAPSNDRVLGLDPDSGLDVQVKSGRFGPYVQVGEVTDGGERPRTASLFSSMEPATLTLEQALELLRIPRTVGTDPDTGEDVVAHNGRFGPYLKRGNDTRSLSAEDQLLTVTLDEARALFAQPKQRRGRTAAPPLRELGADPSTNLPVRREGGSVRALRDRRHDQCQPAQGRRGGVHHHRAGLRAVGRPPGRRPGQEEEGGQEGGAGQEEVHGEERGGEEGGGEEGGGEEGGGHQEGGRQRIGVHEGRTDRTLLTCRPAVASSRSRASTGAASRPRRARWPRHSRPASPMSPGPRPSARCCDRSCSLPTCPDRRPGPRRC